MSAELVPINDEITKANDRRATLESLNAAANAAQTPREAHEVMNQARVISELLTRMRQPFEDAREAGKASACAGRRLGQLLGALDNRVTHTRDGNLPSQRSLVLRDLGIHRSIGRNLIRLGEVPDPEFQRYIQDPGVIPSVNGALRCCGAAPRKITSSPTWMSTRRKRAKVKKPSSPSFDEGYTLIVRALGHLTSPIKGSNKKRAAVSAAIDHLYAAEELLKPYRGGYAQ